MNIETIITESIVAAIKELYGEEMPKQDIHRQRYIKTEEYLKKHPQASAQSAA